MGEDEESEENTDDEIERIRRRDNEEEKSADKPDVDKDCVNNQKVNGDDDDGAYDNDTDIDEDSEDVVKEDVVKEGVVKQRPDTNNVSFDHMDTYFSGKKFFLYGDFMEDERKLLTRYIVMFGGLVNMYMAESVGYVVTKAKWDKQF